MENQILSMNQKELLAFIENMSIKKEELEKKFNKNALSMCNYIATVRDDSHFAKYKGAIKEFFDERPKEPIAYFLQYVYSNKEYVNNIKEGNDNFFITDTFNNVEKDQMSQIFEFKDLWKSFNNTTKESIKKTMKLLVDIASIYLDILHNKQVASKKLKSL
jgi:hypothetical protein